MRAAVIQRTPPSAGLVSPAARPLFPDHEQHLKLQMRHLEDQFDALRGQIRQLQQLAALGTAAALIAHEFKNLVTPSIGRGGHALNSGDPEKMKKALETTLRKIEIVTAMAERTLGLAVYLPQSLQPVALRSVVEEAVECLARHPSKDGITLRVDVDDDLHVRADDKQLVQLFFNLLLNARQAVLERKGRITIEARAVPAHGSASPAHATPQAPGQVEIRVRDNGCGIARDRLDTIFEPFVTTRNGGPDGSPRGTGLGLALCRDIVTEHGGTITVESQPSQGTTFLITLPAVSPA